MATHTEYISGKLPLSENLSFTDIWSGEHIYEYPDFISPELVSQTLTKVMADIDLTYQGGNNDPVWCLGQNFWSLPVGASEFDEVFDHALRAHMVNSYSDINHHIEKFVSKHLNRTPHYVPGIATPGFNIVKSNMCATAWHTDGALIRKMPDCDINKIISVCIPIQSDPDSHTEFRVSDSDTLKLTHRPGTMLIWPGRKLHRFGPQNILPGRYRISYQCHVYDDSDRGLIFF